MRFSWVFRLALVIGAGALLMSATVVAVAPRIWRIANAHEETPVELPDFADLSARTTVFDVQGNEIASFEVENSQPVSIDDVPQEVIDAFLAVEDNEFFVHKGVNVRSLFRATLSNLSTEGPIQGASTITMQVVKNDFMAGFPRDGRYKLLQITYAVRLEKHKTKEEILERYLNTVFFGQNSYGIGAAAETYFGKSVQELDFIEAAFLAGMVQAPSTYDPIINPEQSRNRFALVLNRLEDDELLTEAERSEVEETFVIPERVRARAERATKRTYFTEALRDYLLNRSDILGDTYDERYTRLHRGGLNIHTTFDPFLQARAEEARDELPDNFTGIDAALTSLDTRTGAIRAMVGGKGFIPGQREVNLALAPSQTGSSIKLFILAAALQAGATPDDVVDGTHPCRLPNVGDPVNPTFEIRGGVSGGVDTLRRHTVRSINCAFARTSQIVGLNRMVDTVYRMAANPYLYQGQPATEREPIQPFSAFATGANELSTLDMAAGIQTIANEGVHHEPYYVEYIEDASGARIYTHAAEGARVLDRNVALTAVDVMKGVLTGGTARRSLADFASRRPAFGKTGTQQNNWTAFFVGATPELSTAVMVRDPDRYTPMRGIPEFEAAGVPRVQGGTFPARIWGAYMEEIGLEQFEFADWDRPDSQPRGPARLYLPGNECLFQIVGYETPATVPPADDPAATPAPQGFRSPHAPPSTDPPAPPPTAPPATDPPATDPPVTTPPVTTPSVTTLPVETVPTTTLPPVPIFGQVESGTTIPPDVLDPNAPLPSVPLSQRVGPCR
ncbi:MAG: transglycosylase domain-containing protein [Ilumatobacter sp.]|uniref:transglycosylase domain-containing protein n=1 Tax=Ilumatobacter sp. TaxID=1967498 RepID=UPI002614D502|nr:transglycosylase domain-containing protein [Ilumatobacter sp.]MDJ0767888.1 transglycosylase domain-containing protein [Ilumatobacter sp.]